MTTVANIKIFALFLNYIFLTLFFLNDICSTIVNPNKNLGNPNKKKNFNFCLDFRISFNFF